MSKIQIQSVVATNWQKPVTELRIFCNHSFTASTSEVIPFGTVDGGGTAYKSIAVTYDANAHTLTIPQFIIDSTMDGIDYKVSRYTCYFFDSVGSVVAPFEGFTSFRVPAQISSASGCMPSGGATSCCTWAEIRIYNETSPALPIDGYYTRSQIDRLLAAISGGGGGGGNIIVQESDGSPVVNPAHTVEFVNASGLVVSDQGGATARIDLLGIPYSKLTLTNGIVNADINSVAAIQYNKLNLTNSILNADINTSAAIVDTKLATISTAGKVADTALSSNVPLKNVANVFSNTIDATGFKVSGAAPSGQFLRGNGTTFVASAITNADLDSDLAALANNSSTGLWAITGAGTGSARTITGTSNQIIVSNGDGVAANPTLSTPQNIHTGATPQFSALGLGGAAGSANTLKVYGTSSGSVVFAVPATGGANTITFPNGTTDFSATGGAGQVVRQTGVGSAFTVGTVAYSELTGTPTLFYQTVQDNGSDKVQRSKLNFIAGSNVTLTIVDDSGSNRTNVTIASTGGGGGSGGHVIEEEGTPLTQRTNMNFVGSAVTASDTGGKTQIATHAQINALADLATNGLIVRTGTNLVAGRTLTGTTGKIDITNGDGVSGNPTFTTGFNVPLLNLHNTFTAQQDVTVSGDAGTFGELVGVFSTVTGTGSSSAAIYEGLRFGAKYTGSGPDNAVVGLFGFAQMATNVTGDSFVTGIWAEASTDVGATGTLNTCWGLRGITQNLGTGTIVQMAAIHAELGSNLGTITEMRGIDLSGWVNAAGVSTTIGIFMDTSIDVGSTKWAIKSLSVSPSLLSGDLTVSKFLKLGTTPVTINDAAGKILSAALNTVQLAQGGTGSSLSDPNANKVLAWDDTDNSTGFWTLGTGLAYDHASHTLSTTGGGGSWTEVTGTSQTMSPDNSYIASNAGLVTLTLPATATVGQVIYVAGKGAGGWKIAQNSGQVIHYGGIDTLTGTSGFLSSNNRRDSVQLVCVTANTDWHVLSSIGSITVN